MCEGNYGEAPSPPLPLLPFRSRFAIALAVGSAISTSAIAPARAQAHIGVEPPDPARLRLLHEPPAPLVIAGARTPDYPPVYTDGQWGIATLECTIGVDGTPKGCRVLATADGPQFGVAAIQWLVNPSHPVFQPILIDGKARSIVKVFTVRFRPPK
jgi:hypothetical protein